MGIPGSWGRCLGGLVDGPLCVIPSRVGGQTSGLMVFIWPFGFVIGQDLDILQLS